MNLHPFPLNAMLNWGSVFPLAKFLPIERPLTKQIKDDTQFQHCVGGGGNFKFVLTLRVVSTCENYADNSIHLHFNFLRSYCGSEDSK